MCACGWLRSRAFAGAHAALILQDETSYIVFSDILSSLHSVTLAWAQEPAAVRDGLRAFVLEMTSPLALRLGWAPAAGESRLDALLRPVIVSAAGGAGEPTIVAGEFRTKPAGGYGPSQRKVGGGKKVAKHADELGAFQLVKPTPTGSVMSYFAMVRSVGQRDGMAHGIQRGLYVLPSGEQVASHAVRRLTSVAQQGNHTASPSRAPRVLTRLDLDLATVLTSEMDAAFLEEVATRHARTGILYVPTACKAHIEELSAGMLQREREEASGPVKRARG